MKTPPLSTLIEGYRDFKTHYFDESSSSFTALVEQGQKPKVLVIACCDSRVDPAIVTGSKPGDLFVIRNVANLVPPFQSDPTYHGISAALEFGVRSLNVQHIIVFGHSHCGGIRALMDMETDKPPSTDFIETWMRIATPAKQQVLADYPNDSLDTQAHHCEKASLAISLNNLRTFPWIQERMNAKQLVLHGWYFNLATGEIETHQSQTGGFTQLLS